MGRECWDLAYGLEVGAEKLGLAHPYAIADREGSGRTFSVGQPVGAATPADETGVAGPVWHDPVEILGRLRQERLR